MPPSYTTSNVIVGYASVYTAPANTTRPADTLAEGATWLTPWTYIGATEEGVTQTVGTNTAEITIEEQSIPVMTVVQSKSWVLGFSLSEETVENMKLAFGGGTVTTIAAATGVVGKKVLKLSDTLDQLAVGFEALNASGKWLRVYVPSVLSVGTVATQARRAANNRAYPVELHANCRPDQIEYHYKTADALP